MQQCGEGGEEEERERVVTGGNIAQYCKSCYCSSAVGKSGRKKKKNKKKREKQVAIQVQIEGEMDNSGSERREVGIQP